MTIRMAKISKGNVVLERMWRNRPSAPLEGCELMQPFSETILGEIFAQNCKGTSKMLWINIKLNVWTATQTDL